MQWLPIDTYIKQLLEGKAEALLIIRYPFGGDVVHGVFQHLLVSHVRLNQVLEAADILSVAVKLQRMKRKCIHED